MVWFRVDDNLAFHPKAVEAGNSAMGLWVRAGAWSAANLTNGFIPTRVAFKIGSRNLCYRLVDVGLFEEKADGFQFHGWDEKNFTKHQVEDYRTKARKRKSDQRKRHLSTVDDNVECHGVTDPVTGAVTDDDVTHNVTGGLTPAVRYTHPIPSLPSSSYVGEEGAVGARNGTPPPPPQFCIEHPNGTPKPCRACQAYRKRYETWMHNQSLETRNATQAQARAERTARYAAIDECSLCDDDGYRPNATICDHIDHGQTNAEGIAAVREALAKSKAKKLADTETAF